MTRLCLGLMVFVGAISGYVAAEEIHVEPGADLQAAIDAAEEGDIIVLASGEYVGGLYVNKSISFIGSGDEPSETIIVASDDPVTRANECDTTSCYSAGTAALSIGGTADTEVNVENLCLQVSSYVVGSVGLLCLGEGSVSIVASEVFYARVVQSGSLRATNSVFTRQEYTFSYPTVELLDHATAEFRDSNVEGSPWTLDNEPAILVQDEANLLLESTTVDRCDVSLEVDGEANVVIGEQNRLYARKFEIYVRTADATVQATTDTPFPVGCRFGFGSAVPSDNIKLGGYASPSLRHSTFFVAGVLESVRYPEEIPYLQLAVDAVRPHGIVYISAGIHADSAVIDKPIRLIGEDGAILAPLAPWERVALAVLHNASEVTFRNLEIQDAQLGIHSYSPDLRLEQVAMAGCEIAILAGGKSGTVVEDSTLAGNGLGMVLIESADCMLAESSVLESQTGVQLSGSSVCALLDSTIEGSSAAGIAGTESVFIILDNSTIRDCESTGIDLEGSGSAQLDLLDATLIRNSGGGLSCSGTGHVIIEGCTFQFNEAFGVRMAITGMIEMRGLLVQNNAGPGLHFQGSSYGQGDGELLLEDSQIMWNEDAGVRASGGPGTIILRNLLLSMNEGTELYVGSSAFIEMDDCHLHTKGNTAVFVETSETTPDGEEPWLFKGWVSGRGNKHGHSSVIPAELIHPSWIGDVLRGEALADDYEITPQHVLPSLLERIPPGSAVRLQPGDYEADLTVTRGLTITGTGADPSDTRLLGRISITAPDHSAVRVSNVTFGEYVEIEGHGFNEVSFENIAFHCSIRHFSRSNNSILRLEECSVAGDGENWRGLWIWGQGNAKLRDVSFSGFSRAAIEISGDASLDLRECSLTACKYGLIVFPIQFGSGPRMAVHSYEGTITGIGNWIPGPEVVGGNASEAVAPSSILEVLPEGFFRPEPIEQVPDAD